MVADSVSDTLEPSPHLITPAPEMNIPLDTSFIPAIARLGGCVLSLLDADALVRSIDIELMDISSVIETASCRRAACSCQTGFSCLGKGNLKRPGRLGQTLGQSGRCNKSFSFIPLVHDYKLRL